MRGRVPLSLWFGGTITAVMLGLALLGQVWTPEDPLKMRLALRLKPPGAEHLFGTDQMGRDVLSIVMAGAGTSLGIALLATFAGGALGTALGLIAAARRGVIERALMAGNGILFAFPPILSAILLGALMGPGGWTATLAIGIFMVPVFARVSRAAALQIHARDHILAARMAGKGDLLIALHHVLPNIASQLQVQVAIQAGLAILTEAGISFLGMGVPPPAPGWGRMLSESQTWLSSAPHLVLAPGLAIAVTVMGLNLLGDGLRDHGDPRRDQGF